MSQKSKKVTTEPRTSVRGEYKSNYHSSLTFIPSLTLRAPFQFCRFCNTRVSPGRAPLRQHVAPIHLPGLSLSLQFDQPGQKRAHGQSVQFLRHTLVDSLQQSGRSLCSRPQNLEQPGFPFLPVPDRQRLRRSSQETSGSSCRPGRCYAGSWAPGHQWKTSMAIRAWR